ncbi:MAG: DEAD/DEAH box helicase [Chloroflexi bacterium]|nr:DEAD/DEAH box helicase [Chloroflexota bacterium]
MTTFAELGLLPTLVQTVTELGYAEPTPIQAGIIPLMLAGQDVLGQAQTGTGKTAAFTLPILHNLIPDARYIQTLVLAPTRELALQVARAMKQYGRGMNIDILAVYGGQPYEPQIRKLRRGVDIVVGTPGRMLDLIDRGHLDLGQVSTVVLDEADEMLSMGFIEDIESILKRTPGQRQTTLFSATLPSDIRRLANDYLHDPQSVTIARKQLTVATISQRSYVVSERYKLAALTRLFEVEPVTSALVFARTRVGTGELANELSARGFPAEALHGDMSQASREQVLRRFRDGRSKVLVATDVAARGLDIDDISHVFNYDLPTDPEVYVHRVGRTARAGKSGVAITLVTPKEHYRLRQIQRFTRQPIAEAELPTEDQIRRQREDRLLTEVEVWLQRGRAKREQEMVETLVAKGYDPLTVAAVALKLARKEEKQRPIMPVVAPAREGRRYQDRPRRERRGRDSRYDDRRPHRRDKAISTTSHEKGMVRLTLSLGRDDGLRPNDVVGTLAYQADIPGRTIGKIFIQDQQTWVDVNEAYVGQILSRNEPYRIGRKAFTVQLAA